jgi:hypothetical protein
MLKDPARATWLDASIPTAFQGQPGNLQLDRSMPVARATLSRNAAGILRNRCPLGLDVGTRALIPSPSLFSRTILAGEPAKPRHQGCKPWSVFLTHGCELHPYAATRLHMPYDGIGTDLAFLHQEVKINDSSNGFDRGCLQEKTP